MSATLPRVAYFERFVDARGEEAFRAATEFEPVRLDFSDAEGENWATLSAMHGYQVSTRGDLRAPWFADADMIARLPGLLAVASTGAGYDVIDVAACTKAGIVVMNQAGSNAEAVAEHAFGFILSLSKQIALTDKLLRSDDGMDRYGFIGADIRGKTLGLVGMGHVGTMMARYGAAFGMTVIACDPYLPDATIAGRGARKVDLPELLATSDFVSLHCPRTDETFGMFDAALFAQMKPTAYFISTARGGIHVETDLGDAVGRGTIAGAGVDVFLKEPPASDHPLLKLDRVIATPHIAGMTEEALCEMAMSAARQWRRLMAGEVPPHLVNSEVWPRFQDRFVQAFGRRPADLPATAD